MEGKNIKQAKICLENTIKIINLSKDFDSFKTLCEKNLGLHEGEIEIYQISYIDDDHDKIVISNNYDYEQALLFASCENVKFLKVLLEIKEISRMNSYMIDLQNISQDPMRMTVDIKSINIINSETDQTSNIKIEKMQVEKENQFAKIIEEKNREEELKESKEKEAKGFLDDDETQIVEEDNQGNLVKIEIKCDNNLVVSQNISINNKIDEEIPENNGEEQKLKEIENTIQQEKTQALLNLNKQKRLNKIVSNFFNNIRKKLEIRNKLSAVKKILENKIKETIFNFFKKLIKRSKLLENIRKKFLVKNALNKLNTYIKTKIQEKEDKHAAAIKPIKIIDNIKEEIEKLKQKHKEEEEKQAMKNKILEQVRKKAKEDLQKQEQQIFESIYPKFDELKLNLIKEESKIAEPEKVEEIKPKTVSIIKRIKKIDPVDLPIDESNPEDSFKKKLSVDLPNYVNKRITNFKKNLLKSIKTKTEKILESYTSTTKKVNNVTIHEGIRCDGCKISPVIGDRYKCVICPDFDYCSNCESRNEHNHPFIKISNPEQAKMFDNKNNEFALLSDSFSKSLSAQNLNENETLNVNINEGEKMNMKTYLRFKNIGKANWNDKISLLCIKEKSGIIPCVTEIALNKVVQPNHEVDFEIIYCQNHINSGSYKTVFRLYSETEKIFFGDEVIIILNLNIKKFDKIKPYIENKEKERYRNLIKNMKQAYNIPDEVSDDKLISALVKGKGNIDDAMLYLLE